MYYYSVTIEVDTESGDKQYFLENYISKNDVEFYTSQDIINYRIYNVEVKTILYPDYFFALSMFIPNILGTEFCISDNRDDYGVNNIVNPEIEFTKKKVFI